MELFEKIVNSWKLFVKISILHVWLGSEYTFATYCWSIVAYSYIYVFHIP